MNYIGKVLNNCKYIYNEINAATLTGAIDVVIVEQPDGTYSCSPFHVRFGKMGVLRSKEKIVDIEINGEPVDIHMKLGESGEAFFVEEVELGEGEEQIPPHLACSPIPPDHFVQDWEAFEDSPECGNISAHESSAVIETPQVVLPTIGSTPRTFRAETQEEEISKKLEGSGTTHEFRPINGQASETSLSSQESTGEFLKEDSPSADERGLNQNGVSASASANNSNSKRKRKRKSLRRKNGSNGGTRGGKNGSTGSTGTDDTPGPSEGIFQFEDLDSEVIQPTIQEKEEPSNVNDTITSAQPPSIERDIHFFSDTEITPGSRSFVSNMDNQLGGGYQLLNGTEIIKAFPRDGDDFAPVQSDTEFETAKRNAASDNGTNDVSSNQEQPQSWRWGELPTNTPDESKHESQKWMIHNMLGFMKKTKHMRHKNESSEGGIYLSDLNSDDPEMTALYFPSAYHRTNLPQGMSGGREEDAESGNGPSLPQSPHSVEGAICGPKALESFFDSDEIALSLCGLNATSDQFAEMIVSYNDFCGDPLAILNNPKLTVRMDRKLYSWKVAAPMIISMAFFHKSLPQDVVSRISEGEAEGSETKGLVVIDSDKPKKPYSSWFTWSRTNQQVEPPITSTSFDEVADVKDSKTVDSYVSVETKLPVKRPDSILRDTSIQDVPLDLTVQAREGKEIIQADDGTKEPTTPDFQSDKYRKTLRLTSQQIESLKLKPGSNEIEFSVTTAYQGTSKCKCFLYCWRYDDKIVVSDIDGTITKSDVLGHILPIVGKDWAQSGVAKLFTKIKDNGYKLLYLSARAIGQSRVTRDYLKSIRQGDLGLPEGPMLLNPTSLLNAFHREVIEKKPEEFKISCLKDIQALFPTHIKPFYAGYGNKINDVWAYQAVGIPIFRIFTINHRGELKHEMTQTFQSTYTNMTQLVDQMFPANNRVSAEDFSEFVYWREPIPDIPDLLV